MIKDIKPVLVMFLAAAVSFRMALSYDSARNMSPDSVYTYKGKENLIETDTESQETDLVEEILAELHVEKEAINERKVANIQSSLERKQEKKQESLRISNPDLYLAALEYDENTSFAEMILNRMINKDAAFFSGLYGYTDGEETSGYRTIQFTDGRNHRSTAASNSQMITAMTSVYAEQNELVHWKDVVSYADWLWEHSHKKDVSEGELYYCNSCFLSDASDSNAENTAGEGDSVVLPDEACQTATDSDAQADICEGHVDVTITGTILSDEELFQLAGEGEPDGDPELWSGWNDENRTIVNHLCKQDWYTKYGIRCQVQETRVPLTSSEIAGYMVLLDEDISEQRKAVVSCALESVGKIPYYWGGKPFSPGYEGNRFGTVTKADTENRIMRGLDCSGWISWVCWSATGVRLPFEGTQGLCTLGQAVTLDELKPGDIAVRTGEDSHAVMYLGTAEDGTRLCIHESSYEGTVSIGRMSTEWEYYRSFLE